MNIWSHFRVLFSTSLLGISTLQAADINLVASGEMPIIATITLEQVDFHETIGVGLSETRYDNVGSIDFKKTKEKSFEVKNTVDAILNITIAPQAGASGIIARTYPLYITPNEKLTITIGKDGTPTFSGESASRQTFLSQYFLENHYQHLPALGYRPTQPEFNAVYQQIDSLQLLRKKAFEDFSKNDQAGNGFDSYVKARLMTEPYLLQTFIAEKKMRLQRSKRLSAEERKTIDQFTITNFKVLPDEALLSKSYRDELRHWIQIPILEKYPQDSTYQQPVYPIAIKEIYRASQQKLASYPQQKAYLATYWLNYATTALEEATTAAELLNEFKQSYPQSAHINYFSTLIDAKKQLQIGNTVPDITFFAADSSNSTLHALINKPVCLVFAFNLRQFENDLKRLEEQFGNKIQFVYLNVSSSIPFGFWKKNTPFRSNVKHVWASPEQIETIKKKFVIETRYPFIVLSNDKKIVQRWIPQEFPHNTALEKALKQASQ